MDHPVRRAVAQCGSAAEQHPRDLAPGASPHDVDRFRRNSERRQPCREADRIEDRGRVGRELDAGAGFDQALGLLEHDGAETVADQREREGEPTDSGTRDDDGA